MYKIGKTMLSLGFVIFIASLLLIHKKIGLPVISPSLLVIGGSSAIIGSYVFAFYRPKTQSSKTII